MHKRPRALLFDHDGVLVESETFHWEAWERLTEELGHRVERSWIRKFSGSQAPKILDRFLLEYLPDLGKTLDTDQRLKLVQRKNDFYMELVRAGVKPFPGVIDLILWTRSEGIKIAVVSNSKSRELNFVLSQIGLMAHFDEILSREDVPEPKPSPLAYGSAAKMLGVAHEDCLVIEDSPTGLEGGLTAKIPCAAVLTTFPREALETPVPGRPDLHPTWIGASIIELFSWLKQLPS